MSGGKMLAFNVNVQNNSVKKHKVNSVSLNGNVQDRFVTYEDLSVQNSVLNFNFEIWIKKWMKKTKSRIDLFFLVN